MLQVHQIMSRRVRTAAPADTVAEAAAVMRDHRIGVLPVLERGRMVGILTDRDIVVRVVAEARSPTDCRVADVMTEEVHFCLDDDEVEEVARRLGEQGIRRMPVLDRSDQVVGVISLEDIAVHADWGYIVAQALRRIAAAPPRVS